MQFLIHYIDYMFGIIRRGINEKLRPGLHITCYRILVL